MGMTLGSDYGQQGSWGFVIFFLVLFFLWRRNDTAAEVVGGSTALQDTARTTAELTFANYNKIRDIECAQGRDSAVLDGKLETGFRAVLDNDNKNTVEILRGQDQLWAKQVQRDLHKAELKIASLEAAGQAKDTRFLILQESAKTDRRLDAIECQMLKQPPVWPTTCVPCSSNPFSGCGN